MQKQNKEILDEALSQVSTMFDADAFMHPPKSSDTLKMAMDVIAKQIRVELANTQPINEFTSADEYIQCLVRNSGFRFRRVHLNHEWWNYDNGPILLFNVQTNTHYAAIFTKSGTYQIYDPHESRFIPLSIEFIQECAIGAYIFYPTLPDRPLGLKDLSKFALWDRKGDIARIIIMQLFVGILGLFIPIATGVILDRAVPTASYSILTQCVFGILACGFSIALFSLAQNISFMRLRLKTDAVLEPAVWDRLLRLPTAFFQRYSPGDLSLRASGIDSIQSEITGFVMQGILSGLFSFITLGLMIFYSPKLAAFSAVMTLLIVPFISLSTVILLRFQRPLLNIQGQLASLGFQFIIAIGKLRISNAESRAFSNWFHQFVKQNRLTWLSSKWSIRFDLIRSLISVLIFIALYALVGFQVVEITFGAFIAFNAAFGQFFNALLQLGEILAESINLVPLYERIKPILQEVPENEGLVLHEVSGKISVRNLRFHYHAAHTPVLDSVSLEAEPGEFIAITGPTGSGKSTLFRLLLGFEQATKGQIYYDGQNINKINIRGLREQCGVVLQNGFLFPGTIFENIMGGHSFSLDQAWEAARISGLDKDIEAMPMGMNTILTERGGTLSVGQRQRLMIARAVSRKPRILLLDEATSALDNITQAEVMRNLEQLKVTRIVAAHRLSTLMKADRIYVLSEGKIVQSGSYQELVNQEGLFASLVQQQRS